MANVAGQIDQQTKQSNGGNGQQPVISELSAELQALGQQVSLLTSALTSTLQTIGQSASQLARVQ